MSEILGAINELSKVIEQASDEEVEEAVKVLEATVDMLTHGVKRAMMESTVARLQGGLAVEQALINRQHLFRNLYIALGTVQANRKHR